MVYDKLDYCANLNNLRSIAGLSNFKFVKGDIGSVGAQSAISHYRAALRSAVASRDLLRVPSEFS